ncbi:S8 family serine peptidase, partial [Dehalococcoidia bacterium]|nr:S8 family serine peptidase [Dehalococcoidia bacterium]
MWSWIIRGIEWSLDQGAHIINMSLGAPQRAGRGMDPIDLASTHAVAAGVVVVTSAGNSGPGEGTVGRPAVAHGVISVAASTSDEGIVWFSSRSPAGDGRIALDVAAPGLAVIAPVPQAIPAEFYGYDDWSGTSMSAPHVAGAVALLLQAFPVLTPAEIEMALKNTADDITDFGGIEFCIWDQGAGRMNVKEAYLALSGGILVDDEWSVGQVLPGVFDKTFTVINNAAAAATLTIAKSVMADTQGVVAGDWITVPATITVPAGATAT